MPAGKAFYYALIEVCKWHIEFISAFTNIHPR